MMNREPDFLVGLQAELSNGRRWLDRAVVLAYATAAGLLVVAFTLLSDAAFGLFSRLHAISPWLTLLWIPACTAAAAWATRRYFAGAAGSGIPQVMVALTPNLPAATRHRFVSLRLSLAKIGLAALGLLGGLSIGREGPSVQVAAGMMQHSRRWLHHESGMNVHALLVAGGSAGIAAAFNAPLAGVVFAIEELSRTLESRNSGLIIAAIVLGGLMGVSAFGNLTYFGVIKVPQLGWSAMVPGLLVALTCGLCGGLFARLLIASLTGTSRDRFSRWRQRFPIRFAAGIGLAIAVLGLVSGGDTYGSGSEAVRRMLAGDEGISPFFAWLKFMATWLTAWSGVPGGIFAPSLSIGAGIGHQFAAWTQPDLTAGLIAMGMAGFLAAATQAPLTAFIIVMEMVDGRAMVLSLMASAMVASLVSRMVSRPLYGALAEFMLRSTEPPPAAPAAPTPAPATAAPAPSSPETDRPAP
jgi:H+/Cl- antiporter ClcA